MRLHHDRRAVAALELALLAPVLITLLIGIVDFGAALLTKARMARTLAGSAEYATLAGQNGVASATIATNARTLASALTSGFVGTPTVTAIVNNGAAAGSKCCPGAAWVCSAAGGFTCADGSTPGTYLTITARYPFLPLMPGDTWLVGKTLTDKVVTPLQ
jgi:Flp pilus assembly protein TadG